MGQVKSKCHMACPAHLMLVLTAVRARLGSDGGRRVLKFLDTMLSPGRKAGHFISFFPRWVEDSKLCMAVLREWVPLSTWPRLPQDSQRMEAKEACKRALELEAKKMFYDFNFEQQCPRVREKSHRGFARRSFRSARRYTPAALARRRQIKHSASFNGITPSSSKWRETQVEARLGVTFQKA